MPGVKQFDENGHDQNAQIFDGIGLALA